MVQLAAQALCLEEMFDRPVAKGPYTIISQEDGWKWT
ncbi:hypothetical protein LR69_00362 [Geobacillus sp. BCO2]|nr:hypothetical protein LR69_00362 [Geobacillus sp. BCO2]